MSDEQQFNLKFHPPVPAYFQATFDQGAAFDLICALREHVNNADNAKDSIKDILVELEGHFEGDLPTGIGDPIDEDGLAAA